MTTNTLIIDGDYPMANGAIDSQRDLTLPIEQARAPDNLNSWFGWDDEGIMATLPEMRKGGIAAALVKVAVCVKKPGHPHGEYRSKENAHAAGRGSACLLQAAGSAERDDHSRYVGGLRHAHGQVGDRPPTTTTSLLA